MTDHFSGPEPLSPDNKSRAALQMFLTERDANSDRIVEDLLRLIPGDQKFILVDECHISLDAFAQSHTVFRFDFSWAGPLDDLRLTQQFERFRRLGASFIVFAWPGLWWQHHFTGLMKQVEACTEHVLGGDGYVLFDLRPGLRAERDRRLISLPQRHQMELEILRRQLVEHETRHQERLEIQASQHQQALQTMKAQWSAEIAAEQNNSADLMRIRGALEMELFNAKAAAEASKLRQLNSPTRKHEVETQNSGITKIIGMSHALRREVEELRGELVQHLFYLRLGRFLQRNISAESILLVVSRGDELLLDLATCQSAHFPQMPDGTHGGNPNDSDEATTQLKMLRSRGATHLLLPSWSFWWLEHYREFSTYLANSYSVVGNSADCRLYDLRQQVPSPLLNPAPLSSID